VLVLITSPAHICSRRACMHVEVLRQPTTPIAGSRLRLGLGAFCYNLTLLGGKHTQESKTMARIEIEIKDDLLDQLSEDFFREENRDRPHLPSDRRVQYHIVARVDGLSVKIWADEHPPPHFHVSYQGQDASFSILDCSRLPPARGLERYERRIRNWWERNVDLLIEKWNALRPSDCPVGIIVLPQSN
jgi:Domain of unknown function (DUF4160)